MTNWKMPAERTDVIEVVGPRSEFIDVTPALAAEWLQQNTGSNRHVRRAKVSAYARDMKARRWELTHQGIGFNRRGKLVDGQHRLRAIIEAGVTIRMLVTWGLDVEYSSQIDRGLGRNVADLIGIDNTSAAAARCLYVLTDGGGRIPRGDATASEVQNVWKRNEEDLRGALDALGKTARNGIRMTGWVIGAVAYAWPIDPDAVHSFAAQLRSGELLERDDPAFTLRNWLINPLRKTSMDLAMGTCNALRYALSRDKLQKLYTGESGYRWLTAKRRLGDVPFTPRADVVEGANTPQPAEIRRAAARGRRP